MRDTIDIYNEMKTLNEAETTSSDVMLYMNTWGNYNEYGADAEQIGGGWKTPDDALTWYNEMNNKGEEPFINDIDDTIGLPFEITEYSNVPDIVEQINDYLDLDEYDRQVIGAILDSGYTDDYEEAKSIYDTGDFVFFPDVSNERDLAYAELDEIGGVSELPIEKLETYIDEDEVYDRWKDEISQEYMEDNDINESELDESELDDYIWEVVRENIQNAIDNSDTEFMEQFFDYDYYGRDLSFDFTFTPYGAINIY